MAKVCRVETNQRKEHTVEKILKNQEVATDEEVTGRNKEYGRKAEYDYSVMDLTVTKASDNHIS